MSEFDVRSSFISVVDHLPSDIIRKLWLIQTLNISYESLKQELDQLLNDIRQNDIPRDIYLRKVSKIREAGEKLRSTRLESLEEAKSINSTIKIAKLNLQNQHSQLQQDRKNYAQELVNNGRSRKMAERSNKRTSTSSSKPTITLKLSLNKKEKTVLKVKNSNGVEQKRGRGRPPLSINNTSSPIVRIKKPTVPSKIQHKRHRKEATVVNEIANDTNHANDDNDEDNQLYCVCRRTSFGDMIACDNPTCKFEWFHYSCVGLTRAPRGRWNCPPCKKMKMKLKLKAKKK